MEHWTEKYERARKAGAWIVCGGVVVGCADEIPEYTRQEINYHIVWPAGVVEALVAAGEAFANDDRQGAWHQDYRMMMDELRAALSPFTSEVGK